LSKEGVPVKRTRSLVVGVVLLAVAVVCLGQEPQQDPGPVPVPTLPPAVAPAPQPPVEAQTVPLKERGVEELLTRLDTLQVQQAELDKAKKETVALLKAKLKQQKQRLLKLGVNVEEETAPKPPSPRTAEETPNPAVPPPSLPDERKR
jgi:hypothetical protein